MKYPDGSTIRVGDLIWLNEGCWIGYVQGILDSAAEYQEWGLDAPHVFMSNVHPFDSTVLGVAYPESCLAGEGVGLLTADERNQFNEASIRARALIANDLDFSNYSVFADIQHNQQVGWIFTFHKNGAEVEKIKVPIASVMPEHFPNSNSQHKP